LRRQPAAGNPEPITESLQAYAGRGVFRGFRATPATGWRIAYEFKWLTKKPVQAVYDRRSGTLTFPLLLPALGKAAAADVAAVLSARAARGTPAHKRIDGRRARITGSHRGGGYTLAAVVRGNNHGYAVATALNVINEIFVTLQERHPEYLIEHFGMSAE
jgi:hypothetical protein